MKAIRDGASHTLFVGESTTATSPQWRTVWAYSFGYFSLSAITPQPRIFLADYDQCLDLGGTGRDKPCKRGWGGFHPGGLNFLLCDGAVRFVNHDADPDLLAELATIDGEEPARLP